VEDNLLVKDMDTMTLSTHHDLSSALLDQIHPVENHYMCPDEAAQTGTPFETSANHSQKDSLAVVSQATWTSKILVTFPHSTATTVSPYLAHLLTEDFLNDFSAVVCLPCLRVLDLDSVAGEAIVLVRGHSPSLYPARDCDCVRGDGQFYCRLSVCCRECRGRLWAIQAGLEASFGSVCSFFKGRFFGSFGA